MLRKNIIPGKIIGWPVIFYFIKIIFFISLIFISAINSSDLPAIDSLRLNIGARPSAMSGAFTAISDDTNALLFNPAGIAFSKMTEVELLHSKWFADITYQNISWLQLLKKGSLAFDILYISAPNDDLIIKGELIRNALKYSDSVISLGYGYPLSDMFSAGINLKVLQSEMVNYKQIGFASDIGLMFKTKKRLFSFGTVIKNLNTGITFRNKTENLPLTLRTGINMYFDIPSQQSGINLSCDYDKTLYDDKAGGVYFGIEHNGMDTLFLRAGYKILNSTNTLENFSNVSLGLGLKIKNFFINYAYLPFDTIGFNQVFSIGLKFAAKPKIKPQMIISVFPKLFSPNKDGVNDFTNFDILVSNTGNIENWEFKISDVAGDIVKIYTGEKNIPSILIWDGLDNSGNPLPSGYYMGQMILHTNESIESNLVKVEVDTIVPNVQVTASNDNISPDNDGLQDSATFYISCTDKKKLKNWEFIVCKKSDYQKNKKYLMNIFDFDTLNTMEIDGILLADYIRQDMKIDHISFIDRKKIEIELAKMGIKNIRLDNIDDLKKINNSLNLTFAIIGKISKTDKNFILNANLIDMKNYETVISTFIRYNSVNDMIIAGKKFSSFITEEFMKGENIKEKKIIKKITGLDNYPEYILWDGKDDIYGYIVPNDTYTIIMTATDISGLTGKSKEIYCSVNIPPKVIVKEVEIIKEVPMKEESRGLKIDLDASILFDPGQSDLKSSADEMMNKVINLLSTYPDNQVLIEGHTDNIGNPGKNLALSSARAWKIYSKFVKSGLKASRFKVKGYGDQKPIADNMTKEGRIQNRRVEIIILKKS